MLNNKEAYTISEKHVRVSRKRCVCVCIHVYRCMLKADVDVGCLVLCHVF